MRKVYSLITLCLLAVCALQAQGTITTVPASPDADKELTITFTAATGSPLYSASGGTAEKVYLYAGVVSGSDWYGCPPTWGNTDTRFLTEKRAANTWSITLSPTVREWFVANNNGYDSSTMITRLGIIFHAGDKKGLPNDYFITVTDNNTDIFTPKAIDKAARPAGTQEGINVTGNSSATFVLYDKDKAGNRHDYAYLVGDFNNWTLSNDWQMKLDETTGCWWYTVDGLEAAKEYAFQYYVGNPSDGWIKIADPYSTKVLSGDDGSIPSSTYPDKTPYPAKGSGYVSCFKLKEEAYNWQVTDFKITDRDNLIIYELLLRDFSATKDLNGALEHLDYLQTLGVNAIELMPCQEFGGNNSWGYNPCFYFAMDKAYGTQQRYKEFIDICHRRGIAVLLDVVYNQATDDMPFCRLFWDAANNRPAAVNPWFNVSAPHPYGVFNDWNHESALTRAYIKRNLQYLLTEYRFDGFRFDLTKGFTNTASNENSVNNYDAKRVAVLKEYHAAMKAVNPHAVMICEHFVESETNDLIADGMAVWNNLNYAYCQAAMGYSSDSNFGGLYNKSRIGGLIGYMESHDEERTGFKAWKWGVAGVQSGNSNGASPAVGTNTNLSVRTQRLATNAAFFLTVPGPKMIWQFGELGYDFSINNNSNGTAYDAGGAYRTDPKPLHWDYADNTDRMYLYGIYASLMDLRRDYPELFAANATFSWKVGVGNWANGRTLSTTSADGKSLVVVGNYNTESSNISTPFPSTGTWYEWLADNAELPVGGQLQDISVPAHGFRLFTNFRPATTGIEEVTPDADRTAAVYYNPNMDELVIRSGEARRVEIYAVSGMLVQMQTRCSSVGLSALPAGIYLAKVMLPDGTTAVCKFAR
ncbi:MAG: alpha-amylase [Prevotellaceae bacterium]|jgi:hypothetical protein|nr:alpha-amylase [Prevotellaceae bacterium]